jgi:hypothetical protein
MSKTEIARLLARQTIAQKQDMENSQQAEESQVMNKSQQEEERALLIQTLAQIPTNATANAKFIWEMKDSQQLILQRVKELEQKLNDQQAALRKLWTIIILITVIIRAPNNH